MCLRPQILPRLERVVGSIDENDHPRVLLEYHVRRASRASRALSPKEGGTTGASPGVTLTSLEILP